MTEANWNATCSQTHWNTQVKLVHMFSTVLHYFSSAKKKLHGLFDVISFACLPVTTQVLSRHLHDWKCMICGGIKKHHKRHIILHPLSFETSWRRVNISPWNPSPCALRARSCQHLYIFYVPSKAETDPWPRNIENTNLKCIVPDTRKGRSMRTWCLSASHPVKIGPNWLLPIVSKFQDTRHPLEISGSLNQDIEL